MTNIENSLHLTPEQHISLCNELVELTSELQKNEHVQCVYYSTYSFGKDQAGLNENSVLVTVVTDGPLFKEMDESYQDRKTKTQQLQSYGMLISFACTNNRRYTYLPASPLELAAANDVFNSTILFDRSGLFSKIKSEAERVGVDSESGLFYYSNRTPIMENINPSLLELLAQFNNINNSLVLQRTIESNEEN